MSALLLLVAHGSPRPSWRGPLEGLREALAAAVPSARVELAYLEHGPPHPAERLDAAGREGLGRALVLPLFLSSQGHVTRDLEPILGAARARWPALAVERLPALGEHPAVVAALAQVVSEALGPKDQRMSPST